MNAYSKRPSLMANKRVYQLARELGLESKDVVERALELGIHVTTASSGLDPAAEQHVRESYDAAAAPELVSEPGLDELQTALDHLRAERLSRELSAEPVPPTSQSEPQITQREVRHWAAGSEVHLEQSESSEQRAATPRRVFVVHGHDESAKNELERFLMDVGLEPIVLHRQADRGMTIIEKLEAHSDVGFAVIILTPDEVAYLAADESKDDVHRTKEKRARPNVILEFGYFLGTLGRGRVCCLYTGGVALPSDMSGILYKSYTARVKEAFTDLRKELIAAGYSLEG
jgi:predicted nucleotide-binding protein